MHTYIHTSSYVTTLTTNPGRPFLVYHIRQLSYFRAAVRLGRRPYKAGGNDDDTRPQRRDMERAFFPAKVYLASWAVDIIVNHRLIARSRDRFRGHIERRGPVDYLKKNHMFLQSLSAYNLSTSFTCQAISIRSFCCRQ